MRADDRLVHAMQQVNGKIDAPIKDLGFQPADVLSGRGTALT
jgi:hypothetical protein